MKKKQEQAMALLDAMERIDESLITQATEIDSPEKFQALIRVKVTKQAKDVPLTAFRPWAAVAVCLAVALVLAISPWFFSTLLPAITRPAKPTAPPTATAPIDYEFTSESGEYLWPSMLYDKVTAETLNTCTEDGTFYCFTDDAALANHFVSSQQELLQYLRELGMETKTLTYYAVDYNDSFSRSDHSEAYIDLSVTKTWQQVLVTLQAMWGDYTDYGYIYALSNQIAQELGWQADAVADMDSDALAQFFQNNAEAINLLYPGFSPQYATDETIRASKTLSKKLFSQLDWQTAIKMDIDGQLALYSSKISDYAQSIGQSYDRQFASFSYCSSRIPLKIKATNAEFYIDAGYVDGSELFKNAFSNYASIYKTANQLYLDIYYEAIEYWDSPYDEAPLPIYFVSAKTASLRFGSNFRIRYITPPYGEAVYTRYLSLYMYGYFKHIAYQKNPNNGETWQSQAFCELGRSNSWFAQYSSQTTYMLDADGDALFYAYTGRTYQPGKADYFEAIDIICFINEYDALVYNPTGPAASMAWYLAKRYGELEAGNLLLHPETVEADTGKTWKELESEWAQYIKDKYKDVVIDESPNQ